MSKNLKQNKRWFLAHTLPRSETRAQMHLRAQSFETYLPQIDKTIRHSRKFRTVRAPLFPRYIFVSLDVERDRWLSIQSTVGVSSLFTCDGRPVAVPRGIVEAFLGRDSRSGSPIADAQLFKGQAVQILSGPFANLFGTLDRMNEAGRVRVLLEIMGTQVPVGIQRSALLPAA